MNIIKIKLTPEQLEKLQPLFEEVDKHPGKGMVTGQAYPVGLFEYNGCAIFGWMTPKEVINRANKAIRKAKKAQSRIIEPGGMTPIPGLPVRDRTQTGTNHFEEAW